MRIDLICFINVGIKRIGFLILVFTIFNCSKDESSSPAIVNSITPVNTFIGDTLTLVGQNLSDISYVGLYNEEALYGNSASGVSSFISKTDTEIKFIVPELYHENVTLYAKSVKIGEVNLVGFIPFSSRNVINPFPEITKVLQILNDDLAFLKLEDGGLLRATDKFNNLEVLPVFNNMDIRACHFFNAEKGWVIVYVSQASVYRFYSTEDGGNTLSLEHSVNPYVLDDGNRPFYSIKYINNNLGYFHLGGNVYRVDDSGVENIKSLYLELNTSPNSDEDFSIFDILDNETILLYRQNEMCIVNIENNSVTIVPVSGGVSDFKFFGNVGYYKAGSTIAESTDYGQTWNELSTLNNWHTNFEYGFLDILGPNQFLRTKFNQTNSSLPAKYEITFDNGQIWSTCYFNKSENVRLIAHSNNLGFADGSFRYFKFINFTQ